VPRAYTTHTPLAAYASCAQGRLATGVRRGAAAAMAVVRIATAACPRDAASMQGGLRCRVSDDRARRLLPTGFAVTARHGGRGPRDTLRHRQPKEIHMPIILWLLGVPLTVIVLLMLFHVL
jgi:hypothetical protein